MKSNILFLLLTPLWAGAQKVVQLDSVQVKAGRGFGITRLKDVDNAGIYAGKKSEVVVLKDLTANTATNNARQLYAKVAGLNIYENDGGAGTHLAIGGRGLDPNRVSNFNTRQNGYDISADALGYPESYYTPPAEVLEKIEIVRGAASLQYGTQFGGIINFRMNRGADSSTAQLVTRLTGGSWGFLNTSTSLGGTVGSLNYYAFYQHKSGDGWRDNSHFNVNMGYGALTWKPARNLSITGQYTHLDYLEHQPGGLNDAMFATDPRMSTKARNWFRVNWNLGAVLLDYDISQRLQLDSRFFGLLAERSALGAINTVNDPGGPRNYRTDNYANWGNESRLVYTYHKGVLLGGVRYYHGYTDREIGLGNAGPGGATTDFSFDKSTEYDSLSYSQYKFPNHNVAVFAENIFRLTSKLSLIPGLRYENIHTRADGFYNNPQQDLSSIYTGTVISNQLVTEHRLSKRSFLIGGLGLSYDQNASMQLYANISQNYKAINFNDMSIVNPNFRVDPNLKDEKGFSADLGVRGHLRQLLNYDVSLFMINYNDRIGTVWLTDTSSITYQYTTNIAHSRNLGVESFVELDLWKLAFGESTPTRLSLFLNGSYIDARYVHSVVTAYENKKVEFVPPVIVRSGLTWQRRRLSAVLQYAYTARQFGDATDATQPSNNGINGLVPSYHVVDFSADYKLSKMILLSATVNNLTNHMYYTRRADSYPGPGIIPADGRSFYLTVQVKI
ncbi:MAG TPA: TonB-dependent receptor [Dinghuibacter sp.]|uniref:TonB-dependent receptor family protein n=1 Tax=Dinghuibacter sp. TaxID=2024697 RepID=UPI002C458AF3|nr:TonB-dependent receptor [Dinghuibacter sp.]HTJ12286.1 TonB-dependent receptor [Dinghuibacter sp.]